MLDWSAFYMLIKVFKNVAFVNCTLKTFVKTTKVTFSSVINIFLFLEYALEKFQKFMN